MSPRPLWGLHDDELVRWPVEYHPFRGPSRTDAAVVAEFSAVGLANLLTSAQLVVVESVTIQLRAAQRVEIRMSRTGGAGDASARVSLTDGRDSTTGEILVFDQTAAVQPGNNQIGFVESAVQGTVFVPLRVILTRGTTVMVVSNVVNEAIDGVVWEGYYRISMSDRSDLTI